MTKFIEEIAKQSGIDKELILKWYLSGRVTKKELEDGILGVPVQ